MHDHSIRIVAGQVKTSSSELPLIDRLSALTVAIIKDEPDATLVSVAALVARHSALAFHICARGERALNRDGTEKIDGVSSKVVKKHQMTQQLDWNGMSDNTL